jgi:hypothetical protein
MINVSKRLEVNPAGSVQLNRDQVWAGLEEKAATLSFAKCC